MKPYAIVLIFSFLLLHSCIEKSKEIINDITFSKLLCDYTEDPMGIDNVHPQLTWIVNSDLSENYQTAYQILVASTPYILDKDNGDIWDSGKIISSQIKRGSAAASPLSPNSTHSAITVPASTF